MSVIYIWNVRCGYLCSELNSVIWMNLAKLWVSTSQQLISQNPKGKSTQETLRCIYIRNGGNLNRSALFWGETYFGKTVDSRETNFAIESCFEFKKTVQRRRRRSSRDQQLFKNIFEGMGCLGSKELKSEHKKVPSSASSGSQKEFSWDKEKKNINKEDYIVRGKHGEKIVKKPGYDSNVL